MAMCPDASPGGPMAWVTHKVGGSHDRLCGRPGRAGMLTGPIVPGEPDAQVLAEDPVAVRLSLGVLWLAVALPAQAATLYRIDQRYGRPEFSVRALGLFAVQGRFPRFEGRPSARPRSAGTIAHRCHHRRQCGRDAAAGPDRPAALGRYFDTAHHPTERFASTSIQALSPTHYIIHGTLRIRGVTQPQDLDATLRDRRMDQAVGSRLPTSSSGARSGGPPSAWSPTGPCSRTPSSSTSASTWKWASLADGHRGAGRPGAGRSASCTGPSRRSSCSPRRWGCTWSPCRSGSCC